MGVLQSSNGSPQGKRTATIIYFLRQGLEHIQQGQDAEGIALLTLCREQLAEKQTHLASIIDTFIERSTAYRSAWQALQKASLHFAEERRVYQSHIALLSTMLPKLLADIDTTFTSYTPQYEKTDMESSCEKIPAEHSRASELPTTPSTQTTPCVNNTQAHLLELSVTCFGQFTVRRGGELVTPCPSRKGQNILRYLLAQTGYSATTDILMATFWPDDEPEVAQSKMHIAISVLRRTLNQGCQCKPGAGYILCKNRVYSFDPQVIIHLDVDEFVRQFQIGQHREQERITAFEHACKLYTGPFLVEDLYADWSFLRREQLSQMYLSMCNVLAQHYLHIGQYEDATKWANAMLKENRCSETAYQHLISIYALQGRRSEALQQYHRCEHVLQHEMGAQPLPETKQIIQMMLLTDHVDEAET
jgi:DNA-binding SARP family transcriptional activator